MPHANYTLHRGITKLSIDPHGASGPHWKKMDPDPGHFFKIFLRKNNFQFFFAYFYPKT